MNSDFQKMDVIYFEADFLCYKVGFAGNFIFSFFYNYPFKGTLANLQIDR